MGAGLRAGPRLGFCLLLLVAVALVAGCGSKSRLTKAQYEHRVRSVYAGVQRAFLATNVRSPRLLAARVAGAQAVLRRAAARLDADPPPREIQDPNHELVEGMRSYAETLDELRAAAARGDMAAVERLGSPRPEKDGVSTEGDREEASPVQRMSEAVEEMTRDGYELGAIAKD